MPLKKFSDEDKATVLDLIAEGKSLREIAKLPGMPAPSAVLHWARNDEQFAERYARAMEQRMDHHAEELLEIADDGSNDWMEQNDKDNPGYKANGEHVQRSKLRVDARKWLMSKLAPKKYGDRMVNEHVGKDGGPIEMGDAEAVQRVAFRMRQVADAKKAGGSDNR